MAHFAKVNENNVIETVINVSNDDCGGGNFPESEPIGQAFIATIGLSGVWLQTSYNNNFRGMYASIGGTYNSINDVFVGIPADPEKPFTE